MPEFHFPGYPAYVEAAARAAGRPIRMDGFAKVGPLLGLSNLCGQAIGLHPSAMIEVLARAREFRDQLEVALSAADAMLDDVNTFRVETIRERLAAKVRPDAQNSKAPRR